MNGRKILIIFNILMLVALTVIWVAEYNSQDQLINDQTDLKEELKSKPEIKKKKEVIKNVAMIKEPEKKIEKPKKSQVKKKEIKKSTEKKKTIQKPEKVIKGKQERIKKQNVSPLKHIERGRKIVEAKGLPVIEAGYESVSFKDFAEYYVSELNSGFFLYARSSERILNKIDIFNKDLKNIGELGSYSTNSRRFLQEPYIENMINDIRKKKSLPLRSEIIMLIDSKVEYLITSHLEDLKDQLGNKDLSKYYGEYRFDKSRTLVLKISKVSDRKGNNYNVNKVIPLVLKI